MTYDTRLSVKSLTFKQSLSFWGQEQNFLLCLDSISSPLGLAEHRVLALLKEVHTYSPLVKYLAQFPTNPWGQQFSFLTTSCSHSYKPLGIRSNSLELSEPSHFYYLISLVEEPSTPQCERTTSQFEDLHCSQVRLHLHISVENNSRQEDSQTNMQILQSVSPLVIAAFHSSTRGMWFLPHPSTETAFIKVADDILVQNDN